MNTKEKTELAKRFNISLPTFYSWEKNKPELIEVIKLGLEKEKEKEKIENKKDLIIEVVERLEKIEKEIIEIKSSKN